MMSNVINLFSKKPVAVPKEKSIFTFYVDDEMVYRENREGLVEYFEQATGVWADITLLLDKDETEVAEYATFDEALLHLKNLQNPSFEEAVKKNLQAPSFEEAVKKNRETEERLKKARSKANTGVLKSYRLK